MGDEFKLLPDPKSLPQKLHTVYLPTGEVFYTLRYVWHEDYGLAMMDLNVLNRSRVTERILTAMNRDVPKARSEDAFLTAIFHALVND